MIPVARCAGTDGMRKQTCREVSRLLVVASLIAFVTACRSVPDAPREIRVGLLALLHGVPKETSGLPSVNASELAAKIVNDRGGIEVDGHPHRVERVVAQIRPARELGIDAVLLGGDMWDMEAFKLMPESDGAFIAHQWHYAMDTPEARSFVELYRDSHGTVPKVTAAMTFDAINLLLRAIESRGSKDPDSIRAALAETVEYTGATGTIRFSGSRDPARSVVISKIHEGETRLFRVVDP